MSFTGKYRNRRFLKILVFCLTAASFSLTRAMAGDEAKPVTGLLSVRAIAMNAATAKVYAVNPDHNAVTILNGTSRRSVAVGKGPVAVAINATTGRVYVANTRGGTVSVLDGTSDAVLATIDVGQRPYAIATDAATNRIFVSNTFSDLLTIIDGRTNATRTIKAGSQDVITTDDREGKAYLLSYESSALKILNESNDSLTPLPAEAMHLWSMVLDHDDARLYVTRIGQGDVVAIDLKSHGVTPIATGKLPCASALNARTHLLYVSNCGDASVTVIDTQKLAVVKTVGVGQSPQAVAVDPQGKLIFVANTHSDSVTVIDAAHNVVMTTLPAGPQPFAMAVDGQHGILFTANIGQPSVSSIDFQTPGKPTSRY